MEQPRRTTDVVVDADVDDVAVEVDEPTTPSDPTPTGKESEERGKEFEASTTDAVRDLYDTRRSFSLSEYFPPLAWVPTYIRTIKGTASEEERRAQGRLPYSLHGDVVAGITVGFMLVPQCLAFALLAGLPVHIGLYSSFLPLVIYAFFGTIRQVQPGPTAVMSLLTGQTLDALGLFEPEDRIAGASTLAVYAGCISIILGTLKFGLIVDFIPHGVMSAFCTAAGLTIGASQLKHVLGISAPRSKHFYEIVWYLLSHFNETQVPVIACGGFILMTLLFMRKWKTLGKKEARLAHPVFKYMPCDPAARKFKVLKMLVDMSALIAVVVGISWGRIYAASGVYVGIEDKPEWNWLVGKTEVEGFLFGFPSWTVPDTQSVADAHRMLGGAAEPGCGPAAAGGVADLISGAIFMAVVGYLETVAVGGKFAMAARYQYNPNQELMALGFMNICSGICSGYPVTGSFSRTAVNAMLGATSLISTAISGIIVCIAVYVAMPLVEILPLAALAPIIIQGAIGVLAFSDYTHAYRVDPNECYIMVITTLVSLIMTVKEGLMVGFLLGILYTMYTLSQPNLVLLGTHNGQLRDIRNYRGASLNPRALFLRMDARLQYSNSRKLREFISNACIVHQNRVAPDCELEYVVLDCKSINEVDVSGVETLQQVMEILQAQGTRLCLANIKAPLMRRMKQTHFWEDLKQAGGHLSDNLTDIVTIIEGKDPEGIKANEHVNALIDNIENRQMERRRRENKPLLSCTAPCMT